MPPNGPILTDQPAVCSLLHYSQVKDDENVEVGQIIAKIDAEGGT